MPDPERHEPGPELRAAADTVTQDWEALRRYLADQGLELAADPPPRQFAGGFANLNYLIRVNGEDAVLRRPPPGPLPPGAYDMSREAKILSRLHEQFPLAPRCLHLCEDDAILGAPFQISEYRPGMSIRAEMPSGLAGDAETGRRLGETLIDTLARLHQVDPSQAELDDLGKPDGFLARAVRGWRKRAGLATDDWAPEPTRRLIGELGEWLDANQVADGPTALLHNDFKLDNLLLDPKTLTPVALVDWDQGTRGDALFDLATLLSYWTEADDPAALQAMRQMPTAGPGFPSRREAAEAYANAAGRDLSDFRFHRVLALLKTATIFYQLHLRYRSGETDDPRYREFGAVGDALLDCAQEVRQQRMF